MIVKLEEELQKHLRAVSLPALEPEQQVPVNFASRVLAARTGRIERERAFTGVAGMSAVLAMVVLGWAGMRGPAEPAEPACIGWLEMEVRTETPFE